MKARDSGCDAAVVNVLISNIRRHSETKKGAHLGHGRRLHLSMELAKEFPRTPGIQEEHLSFRMKKNTFIIGPGVNRGASLASHPTGPWIRRCQYVDANTLMPSMTKEVGPRRQKATLAAVKSIADNFGAEQAAGVALQVLNIE